MNLQAFTVEPVDGGKVPYRKDDTDAGFDCYANEFVFIEARATAKVKLGFKIALKPGWEGQLRGRSGLASEGIDTHLGTIDAGYRGEVAVILHNLDGTSRRIYHGDRVCQLVIKQVPNVMLIEGVVDTDTQRGEKGFGSSGVSES